MDHIDVVMTAWPNHPKRIGYFDQMVASLCRNLHGGIRRIDYLCSAETDRDPDSDWCGDQLAAICQSAGIGLEWRNSTADLGANMNAALRMGSAPYQLLVQDDFKLVESLDLTDGIVFLESHADFAAVRYHYGLNTTRFTEEIDGFRVVDMTGPWPFSDSCQLRRRTFSSQYGEYLESSESHPVVHGGSESRMCGVLRDSGAKVAASRKPVFKHIGITRAEYRDHRKSRRGEVPK